MADDLTVPPPSGPDDNKFKDHTQESNATDSENVDTEISDEDGWSVPIYQVREVEEDDDYEDITNEDNQLYWCHSCQCEILPILPDLTCSACGLGFVEAIDGPSDGTDDITGDLDAGDPIGEFVQSLYSRLTDNLEIGNNETLHTGQDSEDRDELHGADNLGGAHNALATILSVALAQMSLSGSELGDSGTEEDQEVQSEILRFFNLGGNMGDYVWDQQTMDRIIGHLLEQQAEGGEPPVSDSAIDELRTVVLTTNIMESKKECPVCLELWAAGDNVKAMPCDHLFHESCLRLWLKRHGNCPVCRSCIAPEVSPQIASADERAND